jgi:hypothetical protein
VSATLKVTQESHLNPAGIMRGTFDVVVDGKSAGPIKWHEAIEVPVEPGHHTLQVRKGRYSSKVKAFPRRAVGDGDQRSHVLSILCSRWHARLR